MFGFVAITYIHEWMSLLYSKTLLQIIFREQNYALRRKFFELNLLKNDFKKLLTVFATFQFAKVYPKNFANFKPRESLFD